LQLWTIWEGAYGIAGVVKAAAALLAVAAALVAIPLVPRGLALASGEALRQETAARDRADQRLEFLHEALRQVGEADDLAGAFAGVLSRLCDTIEWDLGEAW